MTDTEAAPPLRCRTPIGVSMIQDSEHSPGATLVVCDDGTAWFLYGGEWVETTPIPGTRAGCEPHLHPRPPVEKGIYDADDDPIPS